MICSLLAATAAFSGPLSAVATSRMVTVRMSEASRDVEAAKQQDETIEGYPRAAFVDEPSSDPMVTCFLAPEWMDAPESKWVCQPMIEYTKKDNTRSTYGDDSY